MRSKKAFSLIELIIVIVLTSLLSVASYSILTSLGHNKLIGAADSLVSDIKFAKNHAIDSNKWTGVQFNVSPANSYSVYETDGTNDVLLPLPEDKNLPYTVSLGAEYQGVLISGANIAGGNKVEFNPLGEPFNDKTGSTLAATGEVTLSLSSQTRTIRITPRVGKVFSQ